MSLGRWERGLDPHSMAVAVDAVVTKVPIATKLICRDCCWGGGPGNWKDSN